MANKLLALLLIFAATLIGWSYFHINRTQFLQSAQIVNALQNDPSTQINLLPISSSNLIEPVDEFRERITKKPFGIFITPETSPVQPDRFTGYHTGVDAEFSDIVGDVPVKAIADGTVIISTWATGYGGVVVIKHVIDGASLFAIYGHLDPASFLPPDTNQVKAGDQIGILGDDHSRETDDVRKHLHFSLYTGEKIDFRGYVKTKEELIPWLNPLDLYR